MMILFLLVTLLFGLLLCNIPKERSFLFLVQTFGSTSDSRDAVRIFDAHSFLHFAEFLSRDELRIAAILVMEKFAVGALLQDKTITNKKNPINVFNG